MAKFKVIIDVQDGKPVFINPEQVKAVFQFNDSKETCIVMENGGAFNHGMRIAVNAAVIDVVEYLEDITDTIQLHYFNDVKNETDTTDAQEKKLYKVLINCPTAKSVQCAVTILVKNEIVKNTESARIEAIRDISAIFAENPSAWFTAATDLDYTTATALKCDMQNSTCINAKIEEM